METNTLRFVILGDKKSGKTTFFNKLINDNNNNNHIITPTIGVDVHTFRHQIYNYISKVIIWDTSGDDKYRSIVNSYIPNSCGYILFFDLNNKETFENLEDWIKTIIYSNKCFHKHPIFLIGNKKDLGQHVSNNDIGNLVEKYQLIYITTSCKEYDSFIIMDAIINEIFIRFIATQTKCNAIR